MSRVQAIEAQITELSDAERAELRDWFVNSDHAAWDRQIEADSASGRLDQVFADPLRDHANGKSTPL